MVFCDLENSLSNKIRLVMELITSEDRNEGDW
jgi:hypothetical protein